MWYNCNHADNIDLIYIELCCLDLEHQNEHHVAFRNVKISYRTFPASIRIMIDQRSPLASREQTALPDPSAYVECLRQQNVTKAIT